MRLEKGRIKLPKVGWVKVKAHRLVEGTIKTVTISKTPSGKCEYLDGVRKSSTADSTEKISGVGLFVSSTGKFGECRKNFQGVREKVRIVKDVEQ